MYEVERPLLEQVFEKAATMVDGAAVGCLALGE